MELSLASIPSMGDKKRKRVVLLEAKIPRLSMTPMYGVIQLYGHIDPCIGTGKTGRER